MVSLIPDFLRRRRTPPDPSAPQMQAIEAAAVDRWETGNTASVRRRIDAAIVPMTAYDSQSRGHWGTAMSWETFRWQREFQQFDQYGPGIVGLATDIPAQTSRLVKWRIQHQDPFTLEWVDADDDAVARATLGLFRNRHQTTEDLAAEMMRKLDGPGEYVSVRTVTDRGHEYQILNKANVTVDPAAPSMVEVRTKPGADKGSYWYSEVPITAVAHVHNADTYWPGLPTSQFQRVLPDIRAYQQIVRYLGRNYRSRLALNGVLWAKATADAQNWPQKIVEWAGHQYDDYDDRNPKSMAPYPLATDSDTAPTWIRTHAPIEQIDVDTADWFLRSFSRGMDFPSQMLLEGPGSATHWGDFVINDYYADFVMNPRAIRVADILTHHVLRPWARIMADVWGDRDPERYRVFPDLTDVRTRTDNTDRILALGDKGVLNRKAQADAAGATESDMLELPNGMTEAEWFLRVNGVRSTGLEQGPDVGTMGESVAADPRGPGTAPTDRDATGEDRQQTPNPPTNPDGPVRSQLGGFDGEDWSRDSDLLMVA